MNYLLMGQMRRERVIFRFGRPAGPEAEAEFKQSAPSLDGRGRVRR